MEIECIRHSRMLWVLAPTPTPSSGDNGVKDNHGVNGRHYGCAFISLGQLEVVVLNACNYWQFVGKNPCTEKHLANQDLDLERKRR